MKKILLFLAAIALFGISATTFPPSANIWKVYSTNDSLVITQGTVGAGSTVQQTWRWSRKTCPIVSQVSGKQLLIASNIPEITKGNIFGQVSAITLNFNSATSGGDSIVQSNGHSFSSALACQDYIYRENFTDSTKLALDTIGVKISNNPCSVYQINIVNSVAAIEYVKLYNTATPTKASIPVATISVPSGGSVFIANNGNPLYNFSTALGLRCSTGPAYADAGEPTKTTTNQVIAQIKFK